MQFMRLGRHGQSLFEVLLAAAITALVVAGAVGLISPVLKNDREVAKLRIGGSLTRELLENIRVMTEANWHSLAGLSTTTTNHYFLISASSSYATSTGEEAIALATTTFTRYFFVEEVRRDATQTITTSTAGSVVDPSTRKVTVIARPVGGPTSTISQFLTRSKNTISAQSDWSGGVASNGFIASTTVNVFTTSSGISFSTSSGGIMINL